MSASEIKGIPTIRTIPQLGETARLDAACATSAQSPPAIARTTVRSTHATSVYVGQPWRVVLRDLGLDELAVLRRAEQPPNLFDGDGSWISVGDYYALFDAVDADLTIQGLAILAGRSAA